MARHLYTGTITAPQQIPCESSGWLHITCSPISQGPVAVAATREGLPGGDVLAMGGALDLYARGSGVWLMGAKDGRRATVTVELRDGATYRHVSPILEWGMVTSWKGSAPRLLPEKQWLHILTRVNGMVGCYLRVEGGEAWIGTHVDLDQKPYESDPTVKGDSAAFPIRPNDPPLWLPGNSALYAWADRPGVTLYCCKVAGAAEFVLPEKVA